MKKAVVVIPLNESQRSRLTEERDDVQFTFLSEKEISEETLSGYDALIGNVSPSLLKEQRHLEWIQLNSSGADAYAIPGVVSDNTVLTCATGAYGLGISEYMVGMLMAMMKKIPGYLDKQKEGIWSDLGAVDSPFGKRVLVVGTGNIGLEFAKRMRAFGCKLAGIRNRADVCPEELDEVYGIDQLAEQVGLADVIALSLPGTRACFHLFDEKLLAMCKEGAYLMNVGRGNVVDNKALLKPEIAKRFQGIWLDVCETEPLPEQDPLFFVPNLLLTPHITGGYHLNQTVENILDIVIRNLNAWMDGTEFCHIVSREHGYSLA